MKVTARLQQTPREETAHPPALDSITVEVDQYGEGRDQLVAQVPEGWQVIAWMVEREPDGSPT